MKLVYKLSKSPGQSLRDSGGTFFVVLQTPVVLLHMTTALQSLKTIPLTRILLTVHE